MTTKQTKIEMSIIAIADAVESGKKVGLGNYVRSILTHTHTEKSTKSVCRDGNCEKCKAIHFSKKNRDDRIN